MKKVLIDTCFINKFKDGTKLSDDFALLMEEMMFSPVIHPYVYKNEMALFDFIRGAVEKNVISIASYEDFIQNDVVKLYYSNLFKDIYNEFVERLVRSGSPKADKTVFLTAEDNVFEIRKSGSSIGDVHIIMMSLFMGIPIILSEDSDMDMIYQIAKNKIQSKKTALKVYRFSDIIDELEKKDNCKILHKDLKRIKRSHK